MHFASQFGHSSTAEVLLRAGISRDARTKVDRTPLHVASQEGHIDIVELLIRNGADIEAKDMVYYFGYYNFPKKSLWPEIEQAAKLAFYATASRMTVLSQKSTGLT